MSVQSNYTRYAQEGYVGDLARPSEPYAFDAGLAQVPTGGRKPRPGDAVYYDVTNNGFAVPTDAVTSRLVSGIVSYDPGTVASRRILPEDSNANSDSFVEFDDGAALKVGVFGTFWVIAGGPVEYGQRVAWQTDDQKWDAQADPAAIAALTGTFNLALVNTLVAAINERTVLREIVPIICVSPKTTAVGELIQVRIGYGR